MNTPTSFADYFKNLVNDSVAKLGIAHEIKDFVWGDSRRIIGKSRSDLDYPCLFLEVPSFQLSDNFSNDLNASARSAFSILINSEVGDWDKQNQIWNDTYKTGIRVLGQMYKDRKSNGFYFNLNGVIAEPIQSFIVDNDYGYRFEFQIQKIGFLDLNLCA
jgi:hypothetical protein